MRLKVTECSFIDSTEWVFKLVDEANAEFYIMNRHFYALNKFKDPVSKHELDYLDKGMWINAEVIKALGKNVVLSIY